MTRRLSPFVIAAAIILLPSASGATTPAPWLIDFSRCEGEQVRMELKGVDRQLTKAEARSLAFKIRWECEAFMPGEMSAAERDRFVKSGRSYLARNLRYHSKAGTYAENR